MFLFLLLFFNFFSLLLFFFGIDDEGLEFLDHCGHALRLLAFIFCVLDVLFFIKLLNHRFWLFGFESASIDIAV